MPTQVSFPTGSTQGIDWKDITPRVGVAYDLFGNGKTAVKFNTGKYMEGLSSLFGLDMNPIFRIPTMTTRPWLNPTNFNFTNSPGCDLANPAAQPDCGPMANQTFGTQVFNTNYDPNMVTGWGNRPYVWSTGVSVQQELLSGVALNVGFYRNSWGNLSDRGQHTRRACPTTRRSASAAPLDPRLPGGGGQTVSGLYRSEPEQGRPGQQPPSNSRSVVGQRDHELAGRGCRRQRAPAERAHGARGHEHRAPADGRLRGAGVGAGGNVEHGHRAGRRTPEQRDEPVLPRGRTVPHLGHGPRHVHGPKVDVQTSVTWQSNPGPEIAANYVASNAVIAAGPQPLGRNLSGGANVTVNLIQPGTLFGPRRNNLDLRLSKVLRFG